METVRMSVGVESLGLPSQFIEKCVDEAQRMPATGHAIDLHYFHFTRRGRADCICVVLHDPKLNMPTDVLLEVEAHELKAKLDQVRNDHDGGGVPATSNKGRLGQDVNKSKKPSPDEIMAMVIEAYQESAAAGAENAIVFVMDNSSPLGRFVSQNLPSLILGIDSACVDELRVAAFPAKAALELLKRMSMNRDLGDFSPLAEPPPSGHFWAISFSNQGKQMAPVPIPK